MIRSTLSLSHCTGTGVRKERGCLVDMKLPVECSLCSEYYLVSLDLNHMYHYSFILWELYPCIFSSELFVFCYISFHEKESIWLFPLPFLPLGIFRSNIICFVLDLLLDGKHNCISVMSYSTITLRITVCKISFITNCVQYNYHWKCSRVVS